MGRKWEASLVLGLRLLLGVLFLFSAYQKLKLGADVPVYQPSGPFTFALAVKSFDLLPIDWVPTFSFVVAWTETVTGIALVLGLWTRAAGLLALLMLISFTSAVISVILRGKDLHCGCFGKFRLICPGPVGWCKVGENLILIAIAYVLTLRGNNGLGLGQRAPNVGKQVS